MHQYKIEIYEYNENGSLGRKIATRYADNHEQAKSICEEYDNEKQENGMKAYKTVLHILCYKVCNDKEAFFAQFLAN